VSGRGGRPGRRVVDDNLCVVCAVFNKCLGRARGPAEGDTVAEELGEFDDFVRARSSALLRTAFLLTGDRGDAEDLLQEVLGRMYAKWGSIRISPEAYARKALVHRSINGWRRSRHMKYGPMPADLPSPGDPVAELAARDEIERVLMILPARQRAVLVLRYLDDLSEVDTAAALGCSPGTVKSHSARGLARLRGLLNLTDIPAALGSS